MEKITLATLPPAKNSQDDWDWRQLYLEQGAEMLLLAKQAISAPDSASIKKGLQIVNGAFFEEDEENIESEPSLVALKFDPLVEPLAKLLDKKEFAPGAIYGLWVCCQEGASVSALDRKQIEPLLDKTAGKSKIRGITVRSIAFRVLLHVLSQQKRGADIMPVVSGNTDLKNALSDELTHYRAGHYDQKPFASSAFEGLYAKGEAKVRQATESLWNLLKTGGDISSAIPYLVENQRKLSMSTSALWVIAGYYLKTKKYKELEAWLSDGDPQTSLRAYRGFLNAVERGISADAFIKQPSIKTKLMVLSKSNGLPMPGEPMP